MDLIFKAFDGKPLVDLNGSPYLVNTLADHVPATPPEFLHQVTRELVGLADFSRCDKIVGEEDRGGYVAAITAYLVDRAVSLVRWSPLGLPGEASFPFRSAYAEGHMYLNGIDAGDRVIVVEDFIDTGGTIIALIGLLREIGAEIVDVLAVAEKLDRKPRERILRETGVSPKVLVKLILEKGTSKVVERCPPGGADRKA
jgi:adenine phosphoribosyltransferase